MQVIYVAGGSIGTLLPMSLQAIGALDAQLALMLPDIAAKIAGALKAQIGLTISPPSLSGSLETAAKIVLNLGIAISGPSFALDFSAIAALIAELQASLGSVVANLALSAALKVTFGHGGLHLLTAEGEVGQMGTAYQSILQAGLPGVGPNDLGFSLLLVAGADPGSIGVLKLLAGV